MERLNKEGLAYYHSLIKGYHTNLQTTMDTALQSKADVTKIVNHTESAVTIQPNVMNVWTVPVSNLKVTKGDDIEGIVNNYMIRFTAGNETVVIFEGIDVKWYGGDVPTWTAYNTYEISIVDNIALWAEFEA